MGTVDREFDVIIIGAGPGGCSAALTMRNSGLRVAIVDKANFPREKVCGELMHRKAVLTLNSIVPGFEQEFEAFPKTLVLKRTKVHFKQSNILFDWVNSSYTCPRFHLDEFLLRKVQQSSTTEVYINTTPDRITVANGKARITFKNREGAFVAPIVIGADGAQSVVAKQLAAKQLDKKHYLGAVRAYYENVSDISPDTSEVFFHKKFKLNYLWVFPVEGNLVNVGFGMLSQEIADHKVNLKEAFYDYFKEVPHLGAKFKNARMVGNLEGFGVPLGSSVGPVAGDNFLLVGDAASLSNPLSGTGMGNAVLSGKLAGEQAIECFKTNNFTDAGMTTYKERLQKAVINDLMNSYKAQRTISKMPFMLDVVFALSRFKRVRSYLQGIV
jgi:menaquinone-9 beta-reductase